MALVTVIKSNYAVICAESADELATEVNARVLAGWILGDAFISTTGWFHQTMYKVLI